MNSKNNSPWKLCVHEARCANGMEVYGFEIQWWFKFKVHVFKKCCGSLHIVFSGYQSDERVVHVFSTEQRWKHSISWRTVPLKQSDAISLFFYGKEALLNKTKSQIFVYFAKRIPEVICYENTGQSEDAQTRSLNRERKQKMSRGAATRTKIGRLFWV